MSRPLVEITGFEELQRKIQLLGNDRKKRTEILKILRKVAQATVKAMRREAPVHKRKTLYARHGKKQDRGTLQKSIGTITGKDPVNAKLYVGARAKGSNDGYFGSWVNDGHRIFNKFTVRGSTRDSRGRFVSLALKSDAKRRGNKKGSVSMGDTKANDFSGRAYDQTKGGVTADAESSVAAYIQKRIDALGNGR